MERLEAKVRQVRVLELVLQGKRFGEIANALGVSYHTVRRDVDAIQPLVEAEIGQRWSVVIAAARRALASH
jgi:DNA-binding NarL/FixJ family response regulator